MTLPTHPTPALESRLIAMVEDSVHSPKTARAYRDALQDFLAWRRGHGQAAPITRALVAAYLKHLLAEGLAPSSVNVRLSAIRKLAREAAQQGHLEPIAAEAVASVRGVTSHGVKSGNWLTREQAQALIESPRGGRRASRDRAILAVFVGCGLRLSEVANLEFKHLQQREGRWVILDLVGKKNRVRTVPIPAGVKASVDAWAEAAGISSGFVFRRLTTRGDHLDPQRNEAMSEEAVYNVVQKYGGKIGVKVSPHDLRRTFAKLARKGGASLEQIQLSLGHASIQTTDIYLGSTLDLEDAPCDHLGLRFNP